MAATGLAATGDGELWSFWDQYEGLNYAVYGRRVAPDHGPIERLSPPGKSCLKPTAVYGADAGLVAAWVANIDVIGGEGAIDQWNTLQGARRENGTWTVFDTDGAADLADLSHGLLFPMEPKPGIVTGYSARILDEHRVTAAARIPGDDPRLGLHGKEQAMA